jgi:predicted ATP-grasp superfamily ATP-dependent carboligase
MPFALGMVRKLAAEGREIYAADDHLLSPGNHSKYLAGHFVYPSPRSDTAAFLDELERIAREHEIDVIVPAFEEAFYISTQLERLSRVTRVFTSPFRTLGRLHDKGAFKRLVAQLGLPIPETVLVTSDEELRQATGRLERYFARGAFSRGGVCCLTNTGPLAGALQLDEVHPTPASPWLVQPFVDGETVCTYSTVHQGRVSSHLMYRIPRQRKHSTGIQFEAIDATESLKLIEPIVAELHYTGQISFDFLVSDDGLTFVECNPRATDGLLLMPRQELAAGLLDPRSETFVLTKARRPGAALARRPGRRLRRSAATQAPVDR